MTITGLSIIGAGRGVRAESPFTAMDPAAGTSLQPEFFPASSGDVEKAAQLAKVAFEEYGRWPAARREKLLNRIADSLEANAAEIIERANLETALPPARLQGEMARTCGQLRLFAKLLEAGWWADARIDHANPDRKPAAKPDVRSMLVPLGPVAVFGASNFPLAFSVAGGDTASALAAGCPVIVKAHEGHPGTSELVGLVIQQAVHECGAPEGVFSLLQGMREVAVNLVKHPLVKAVGFTGSQQAGRALMDLAAARPEPIPVFAEMSSINPVFLLRGALDERAEQIATGLHASVTLGVGQFCTNPGVVFIEPGARTAAFIEKLRELTQNTPPGAMLNAHVCSGFRHGVERLENVAGVRALARAEADERQGGAMVLATDAVTFLGNPDLMEEVFGPSTLLVECASREDLIACARKLVGQLTATIHAAREELSEHGDLIAVLQGKAGRLLFDGFPTGVEVCHAMNHGGPYPATSDGRSTSVGTRAISRFTRPVCFQDFPDSALPPELQEANPRGIARLVDGKWE